MTGQEQFGSYDYAGAVVAANLVNELTLEHAYGRSVQPSGPLLAIQRVLEIDPPSAAQLRERDVPGFIALAERLRDVFRTLHDGDLDAAAGQLDELLAAHRAPR